MKRILKKIFLILIFTTIVLSFGLFAYIINKIQDKEFYLQSLLIDNDNKILKAFFSPDDNLKDILLTLIACEKKSIKITMYTITEKDIAQALIDAHKKGIKVECISDRTYGADKFSKIPRLANYAIPIWVYQTEEKNGSLMHNKFVIFEDNISNKSIIWTGSYNFTKRAGEANQENVIIIDNQNIFNRYNQQFDIIKKRSLLISGDIKETYNYRYDQNKNKKREIDNYVDYIVKQILKFIRYI